VGSEIRGPGSGFRRVDQESEGFDQELDGLACSRRSDSKRANGREKMRGSRSTI